MRSSQCRRAGCRVIVCVSLVAVQLWTCQPILAQTQEKTSTGKTGKEGANDATTSRGKSPDESKRRELPWLESMVKAYTQSQRKGQPILVRVGGESCPYCQLLASEIKQPAVQDELDRWVLVYIDVDKSPSDARLLGVGPIPALRLLSATGKVVASHDGAMAADALVEWLQQHHDRAAVRPAEELTADGPPDILAVVRIVRQFKGRDAIVREAAIRRLIPHPDVAAAPVVAALTDEHLATRLTSLELLKEWKAPIEGVDPWRLKTLTEARLKALNEWALSPNRKQANQTQAKQSLTPAELKSARRTIEKMLLSDPVEAKAIQLRLSRHGRLLLPEVYARLNTVETDVARERLTALRYHLVASKSLVLNWPGGLERLSATDVKTRQQAADELAKQATSADEALLLELFSDPAPLVREIGLRALQEVGGSNTSSALVGLLDDPEPNVRAAVLKQLAEAPSARIVAKISEYVAREKDPDLIVHAVRLLRETKVRPAVECLMTLLHHESWRVRAEAAEAIGKSANSFSSEQSFQVDAYVALIDLLEDTDSFVVSRSIIALAEADLVAVVDPLAKVAATHPDLAVEVVKVLSTGTKKQTRAIPHLKKFCQDENPTVRAAAITGLCSFTPNEVRQELSAALRDEHSDVRIAAGNAFYRILVNQRSGGVRSTPGFGAGFFSLASDEKSNREPNEKSDEKKDQKSKTPQNSETPEENPAAEQPSDARLRNIRAGKVHPQWMFEIADLLKPLLKGETAEERLAGALPLAALGRDKLAIPVLMAVLKSDVRLFRQISQVLPSLLWQDRLELFNRLVKAAADMDDLSVAASSMVSARDWRAFDSLWALLARKDANARLASVLKSSLSQLYFSDNYYSPERASLGERKFAIADMIPRAKSGPKWQRLVALSILLQIARDDVEEIAKRAVTDKAADPDFRADTFQILLLCQSRIEGRKTAIGGLSSENTSVRKRALSYLAKGASSLSNLGDQEFSLDVSDTLSFSRNSGQPIIPEAPEGLTAAVLQPLLQTDDAEIAAYAAYLLILLDEAEDLAPLIDYWQNHARENESWTRLVYRVIAYLDDSSRIATLESIYDDDISKRRYSSNQSDFYWTIRIMTGPRILALRKRIRDEVGMDSLR